ncbi:MAG: UbiH/UbiF/VisC/COQ6 family ubiquinone biosynthesis hydroxylase [Gammaproteobacteria bacterium]|nr:UbiH/UbiF/VisC/COQ6 family ubiquinone biosynthesis hydroxylase [Gammaproteobacteria bacterium]
MTKPESTDISCDVAIAGGGMVGCALACALADRGFHVAVIEPREPVSDWPADEVDLRVSALSRASQTMLENLSAWEAMSRMRVSPYQGMHVWDSGAWGSIRFDAADIGEPDLGHIVENRVTRLALWNRLGTFEQQVRLCPDRAVRFEIEGERARLKLMSGRTLEAGLLVGAEGALSPVRDMAGITSSGWDYDQHAIVATVWSEIHHGHVARQRFMPDGPLALLPVGDGRCSIVWSTSPANAEHLMKLDEEHFLRELTLASDSVLGRMARCGPRGVFPLRLRHADQYVKPGLALIGDAAHGIHPLAGQGVNLGFMDAAALADALVEARACERPLGSLSTLRRYERARKGANMGMLGAMDLFKRLFSNRNLPLKGIRNLGLGLADHSGPVKQMIMRRAMGMVGERPTLARPGNQ